MSGGGGEWELIPTKKDMRLANADVTQRMRVPGGWLYRTLMVRSTGMLVMCFVPDPTEDKR